MSSYIEVKDSTNETLHILTAEELSCNDDELRVRVTNTSDVRVTPWIQAWGASEDNCCYQIENYYDDDYNEVYIEPGESWEVTLKSYHSDNEHIGNAAWTGLDRYLYAYGYEDR